MPEEQSELLGIDTVDMSENEELDGDFIATTLKDEQMVKRNSVDNYKSDSAGVRETLANAVAAIMDAENEGYITPEEGEIEVKLIKEPQSWKLIIRDNGIGMTRERLEILSNMGETTTGKFADQTGKYGIGYYAVFCLTELSGSVILATRARKSDTARLCRWQLRGGKVLQTGEEVPQFGEDEYGTQLEVQLKDDLDHTDVDRWIREHAAAARRRVVYTKEIEAGPKERTVYPNIDVLEEYQDAELNTFSVDCEWFSAIVSPQSEYKRMLLDIHVDTPGNRMESLPWDCAVRFHTEENTIVATEEHSVVGDEPIPEDSIIGKQVVASDQYDMFPDELKDKYIPKRDLGDHDVYTPATAGTRDSLSDEDQFFQWLEQVFQTQFKETIDPILDKNIPEDCTEEELVLIYKAVGDCASRRQLNKSIKNITSRKIHTDSETRDSLLSLVEYNVNVDDSTYSDLSNQIDSRYRHGVYKFSAMGLNQFARENDAAIYMGVSINETKAAVVKEHYDNAIFVKLSEASEYERYEPLGWKKLKNIKKSTLDQFDLSEDKLREFKKKLGNNNKPNLTVDESVTVRFGIGRRGNVETVESSTLKNKLKTGTRICRNNINKMVLFPESEEENVSDHYDLGGKTTCVAKCSDDLAQDLTSSFRQVQTYKEYYNDALGVVVDTNLGTLSGKEILDQAPFDSIIVTLASQEALDMLDGEQFDQTILNSAYSISTRYVSNRLSKADKSVLHMAIDPKRERAIRPVLHAMDADEKTVVYGDSVSKAHTPDWVNDEGRNTGVRKMDTTKWIGAMKLYPIVGDSMSGESNDILSFLQHGSFQFKRGGKKTIQTLMRGASR